MSGWGATGTSPRELDGRPLLYQPKGANYECCSYCHIKIRGMGGSGSDRTHDADCAVVLARVARAATL